MTVIRHLTEIAGLLAIVAGCWQIYPPAAWIAGGVALLLFGFCWWALTDNDDKERQP